MPAAGMRHEYVAAAPVTAAAAMESTAQASYTAAQPRAHDAAVLPPAGVRSGAAAPDASALGETFRVEAAAPLETTARDYRAYLPADLVAEAAVPAAGMRHERVAVSAQGNAAIPLTGSYARSKERHHVTFAPEKMMSSMQSDFKAYLPPELLGTMSRAAAGKSSHESIHRRSGAACQGSDCADAPPGETEHSRKGPTRSILAAASASSSDYRAYLPADLRHTNALPIAGAGPSLHARAGVYRDPESGRYLTAAGPEIPAAGRVLKKVPRDAGVAGSLGIELRSRAQGGFGADSKASSCEETSGMESQAADQPVPAVPETVGSVLSNDLDGGPAAEYRSAAARAHSVDAVAGAKRPTRRDPRPTFDPAVPKGVPGLSPVAPGRSVTPRRSVSTFVPLHDSYIMQGGAVGEELAAPSSQLDFGSVIGLPEASGGAQLTLDEYLGL